MNTAELLDELGIPYKAGGEHDNVGQGWYGVDCPFCGMDGHYRLGIPEGSRYVGNCWCCGVQRLPEVLADVSGVDVRKVRRLLGAVEGDYAAPDGKVAGKLTLPVGVGPLQRAHRDYLRGRGFHPRQLAALWGLQGTTFSGALKWRLFIPITFRGKVVSWTTRKLVDEGQRYRAAALTEESLPHKSLLYGQDLAGSSVLVVEGPTDVWRLGPGAVCTFGAAYSPVQVLRIATFPTRVICYDNEPPEAQEQAHKLCGELAAFPGRTLHVQIDSKDPGSATKKEVAWLRKMLR